MVSVEPWHQKQNAQSKPEPKLAADYDRVPRVMSRALTRQIWLASLPVILSLLVFNIAISMAAIVAANDREHGAFFPLVIFAVTFGGLSLLVIYGCLRLPALLKRLRLAKHGRAAIGRIVEIGGYAVTNRQILASGEIARKVETYSTEYVSHKGETNRIRFEDFIAQDSGNQIDRELETDQGPVRGVLVFYDANKPSEAVAINQLCGGAKFTPGQGLDALRASSGILIWILPLWATVGFLSTAVLIVLRLSR